MTVSELKVALQSVPYIQFALPNGRLVPEYFHITEMGICTKHFIDCGHTIRTQSVATFQLWYAQDYSHRLSADKFLGIIQAGSALYKDEDLQVEVEYQTDLSISIFSLKFDKNVFHLVPKTTNCLADDKCGIPAEKTKISLKDLQQYKASTTCCDSSSGCC